MKLTDQALENLEASGLTTDTIAAMRIRMANATDFNSRVQNGYIIPYFLPNLKSNKYELISDNGAPFFRVRLLDNVENGPKYLQERFSGTHIYFPPLPKAEDWFNEEIPLFITEGEKKAAALAQHGFLACAVSGVDSWRSRTLVIDQERVVNPDAKNIIIQVEDNDISKIQDKVSDELDMIPWEDRDVYIVYDNDVSIPTMEAVQRAAFDLAIWLDHQGASPRQIMLPFGEHEKVAVDDFLVEYGPEGLKKLLPRATYPYRPKIKGWVNKQLGRKGIGREDRVRVAKGILAALDNKGIRYKDELGNYYYFDKTNNMLHALRFTQGRGFSRSSSFHNMLVNDFGLSASDQEIITRLMDQFQATRPIEEIDRAYQGSVARDDAFYFQLSDSKMVKVTKEEMLTLRNGEDGILFESGVEGGNLVEAPKTYGDIEPDKAFGWLNILKQTSLKPMEPLNMDQTYALVAALFYASPWLLRWRGTMLPLELAMGEAGSGKSTLYQLRRAIYTGSARLNQPPKDIKDWYASIGDTHGMWVADNMGSKLTDEFSNEIARMITDPEPTYELRELFTTSDVLRRHVNCTFCFTSIYSPVTKPDLLQRSFLLNFESIRGERKDGKWLVHQIENGGRDRWIAHHLDMIQRFLREAENVDWNKKSSHRLVNLELILKTFGKIMGKEDAIDAALSRMGDIFSKRVADSNPVIEALVTFAYEHTNGFTNKDSAPFTSVQIVEWAMDDMERRFDNIRILQSARSLGKFLVAHENDVYQASGIKFQGERSRRRNYYVDPERMEYIKEITK
jgi:hypothetical protein